MTAHEQKSINAIALKQGVMDERQHNMATDVHEIKQTLKELAKNNQDIMKSLENLTLASEKKYVKKTEVKWYVGLVISAVALYLTVLNYIHSLK